MPRRDPRRAHATRATANNEKIKIEIRHED
jgi:hypothetical protein